ncbi:MAG: hypothetical protein GX306_08400 [Clostridiales bacterium]|jgi:hypothetical protein|nr:hypothetical protein [Clostridiales bacterium]NLL87284.1 hypothetical protein [Syntrophomonadaceae bacterium]
MTDNNDGLRVRHQHNLNENRQNRNRAYYANSISRKQVSPLAFNLTPGALFYPSCGRDSFEPIQMFIDSVTEFHFVDFDRVPPLPLIQRENRTRLNWIDIDIKRRVNSEPSQEQSRGSQYFVRYPANEEKRFQETWEYTIGGNSRSVEIFRHHCDNLEAFDSVKNISVFFYRGDSYGEGGSGQMWMGKELFPKIVEKLNQRAIIVTDGANHDLYLEKNKSIPWQPMLNCYPHEKSRDFYYQDRHFMHIGWIERRLRQSGIWIVL